MTSNEWDFILVLFSPRFTIIINQDVEQELLTHPENIRLSPVFVCMQSSFLCSVLRTIVCPLVFYLLAIVLMVLEFRIQQPNRYTLTEQNELLLIKSFHLFDRTMYFLFSICFLIIFRFSICS